MLRIYFQDEKNDKIDKYKEFLLLLSLENTIHFEDEKYNHTNLGLHVNVNKVVKPLSKLLLP